jgi:hypothetical protein
MSALGGVYATPCARLVQTQPSVPVNQSGEAFFVGCDPAFMIFMDVPLKVMMVKSVLSVGELLRYSHDKPRLSNILHPNCALHEKMPQYPYN